MTKAVIFDWDGVLVDSFPITLKTFQAIFSEMNLDFTEDFLKKNFGGGARRVMSNFMKENNVEYSEEELKELLRKKVEIQIGFGNETKIIPGTEKLLKNIHGRMEIAIASGNNRGVIEDILMKRGLQDYFSVIVSVEDIENPKPAPDIFLKAAEKLGVGPEECVVFEDAPFGMQAAKNADMKVIAVHTRPRSREVLEQENPDLIVDSLEEIDRIKAFLGI